jgi:hypothetical protein
MADLPPNHTYYRTNHGKWTSPMELKVTDWSAFWRAPMSLLDRLRALSAIVLPWLIGPLTMETDLDYHSRGPVDGHVQHRTRLKKWGLLMYQAAESFWMHEDGTTVRVEAVEAWFPFLGSPAPYGPITCTVDPDARAANYVFPSLGGRLDQRVEIVPGGVDVQQRTAWSFGVQRLRAR